MENNTQRATQLLGRLVRIRRKDLDLTQQTLADLAGVGVAFLYDLEQGKPTLRLDKVLAVLATLGIGLRLGPDRELLSATENWGVAIDEDEQ